MASEYLSIKHSSYFQVYDEILERYQGKEIVFVEIGVLNGGSLFMWRNFFGPKARIIGIDFNPAAKTWENSGFEIYIGNQSDPKFWSDFFEKVGMVDVILDDGGHTNEQQIVTAESVIPYIKDDGLLVVEDVHASYMRQFSNPSKYSFINYTKNIIDVINSRFPKVIPLNNPLRDLVYRISFFESIVCMHINRKKCFISTPTTNGGKSSGAIDFYQETGRARGLGARLRNLKLRKFFQN